MLTDAGAACCADSGARQYDGKGWNSEGCQTSAKHVANAIAWVCPASRPLKQGRGNQHTWNANRTMHRARAAASKGRRSSRAGLHAVARPAARARAAVDVGLQLRRERGQVEVQVRGRAQHGRRPGQLAARLQQRRRLQQLAARVALVAARVLDARRPHAAGVSTACGGVREHRNSRRSGPSGRGPAGWSLRIGRRQVVCQSTRGSRLRDTHKRRSRHALAGVLAASSCMLHTRAASRKARGGAGGEHVSQSMARPSLVYVPRSLLPCALWHVTCRLLTGKPAGPR